VVGTNLTSAYTNQAIESKLIASDSPIFNINATASSGLPVVFTTLTPSVCTVSGNTVTGTTTGTCTIAANQAGNSIYGAAAQWTYSVLIRSTDSIVAIELSAPALTVGSRTTATATTTTGRSPYLQSQTPSVCMVHGSTILPVSIGTCTINAWTWPEPAYYTASLTQSFTVGKGSQTITFGLSPAIGPGGSNTVSAVASSGLTVSFSTLTPQVCTVTGNTVSALTEGTCTIAANQAGNANYHAATQATQNIPIAKGNQSITFRFVPKMFVGGTGPISAFATSGLAVSLTSATPDICTVSGDTVSAIAAGSCTIVGNQPGDANYYNAATATKSINVGMSLRISPMVAAGGKHTVALRTDGTVVTWGLNSYGELGDGTSTSRSNPATVPGLSGVVAVAAGLFHSVALKSDGTVVAWGYNGDGRLGDGTLTHRSTPVPVQGLSGVVAVAAGSSHTVALKSDGTVVAWGWNGAGQLGDGTKTNRITPVAVSAPTGVVAVAAGESHTLALRSDGTLVAWGGNRYGQLGDGTITDRDSPVAVPALSEVVAVAGGGNHTMAVKSDGTVATWGWNAYGQLGDGTRTDRLDPAQVPELTGVTTVAAGESHSVALKSDGSSMAWGYNRFGSLGDGTTTDRWEPGAVPGLTDVTAVAAGSSTTFALKNNGTVAEWGYKSGSSLTRPQTASVGLLASQTVNFGPAPTIVVAGIGNVSASANSGLSVALSTTTPTVCSLSGDVVTGVNVGTCIIAATQAGNAEYNAATQSLSIVIGKASQNVTFAPAAAIVYGGTGTVSAIASSGLTVSFSSTTPGTCSVSGNNVTGIAVGTCTVAANQAGSSNYLPASQMTQSITIGKANQTINPINLPATIPKGGTTTASATSTSGLAVSFGSTTPQICTVSGSTVTGLASGTCTITADQSGSANYNPATQTTRSITVLATMSGTVLDLSTGNPITSATVSISGAATGTTQTDSNGHFAFNVPYGSYDITISKTGYKATTTNGIVLSNTSGSDIKAGLVPHNADLLNFTAPPTLPPASAGVQYSQPLTITGGTGPYTFSIAYGTPPAGFGVDRALGIISGTASAGPSATFAVGVTDSLGAYAEREFTISVTSQLAISTTALPRGMTTADYLTAIAATGGAQPYTFSVISGALPANLTLDNTQGMLKGKISASPGVFSFAIRVIDNEGRNTSQSYTLAVDPLLTQTSSQLNDAIVGVAHSQPLGASGGLAPYTWSSYAGNLPAGLALDPATGIISGTPTVATSVPLTLAVTDSVGRSAYKAYFLRVLNPLQIPTTILPNGFVGAPYSELLRVTGGIAPYSFSINGQLPAGLSIDSTTGIVSGTPTGGGFTNVSIIVSDSTWPAPQSKTVTMGVRVWSQLTITSSSIIPNARKGFAITPLTLAARGGTSPYSWSLVANPNGSTSYLPQGITLDPATGIISGTASDWGDFTFTVRVTAAGGTPISADKQFYLHVSDTLQAVTKTVPAGAVGVQYNAMLSAAGGLKNYSWIVKTGTLPAGLELDGNSGTISGTPSAKLKSSVTFEVADSDVPPQSAQQSLSFDISDTLSISETWLPNGRKGDAYQANLRALLGAAPYNWKVTVGGGTLPPGLTLQQNAGIATLQGTPTTPGSYTFTLEVSDSSSVAQKVSRQFTVVVYGPVTITSVALKNAMRGVTHSDAIVAAGGTAPYSWQIVAGNLPQGLVFNSTTGAISGITNVNIGYTASFTVRVTDGGTPAAAVEEQFTIQAIDPMAITTSTLPGATQFAPYSATLAGYGGIAPQSWSIASGSLPAGVTLNGATGALSGTPSACGSFPITVRLADSALAPATVQTNLTLPVTCSQGGFSVLSVSLSGTGSGSVNSSPSGIACTGGVCSATFASGTVVTLIQSKSAGSEFAGWGGACSGTGGCSVAMNATSSVTAAFNKVYKTRIGSAGYDSLNLAYSAAPSTVGVDTTLMALDDDFLESLTANLGKNIVLKGGYNPDFSSRSGLPTTMRGVLRIRSGKVTVDRLTIGAP